MLLMGAEDWITSDLGCWQISAEGNQLALLYGEEEVNR